MNTQQEEDDGEEDDNVSRMETDITDEEMARRWERRSSQSDGIVQEPKTLIVMCFSPSDMKAWLRAWEKNLPRKEIAPQLLRVKTSTAMMLIINPKRPSWNLRTEKWITHLPLYRCLFLCIGHFLDFFLFLCLKTITCIVKRPAYGNGTSVWICLNILMYIFSQLNVPNVYYYCPWIWIV